MKGKLDEYIAEGHLEANEKDAFVELFEQMQGVLRERNAYADPSASSAARTDDANRPLTDEELREELGSREHLMQQVSTVLPSGACSDQWRVYSEIIGALERNTTPLRMFLQASAGTGKTFLLETVCIWWVHPSTTAC